MLVTPHDGRWVSPFGHPRITARLTTPRGLSRPPTSFIGSWCQDIHHVLLHTSPQQDARIHYATLNTQPHPSFNEPPPPRAASRNRRIRWSRPGAAIPEKTRCLLRTQQCAKRSFPRTASVSCSTQPHPPRTLRRVQRDAESVIRKTSHQPPTEKPATRADPSHQHGETP